MAKVNYIKHHNRDENLLILAFPKNLRGGLAENVFYLQFNVKTSLAETLWNENKLGLYFPWFWLGSFATWHMHFCSPANLCFSGITHLVHFQPFLM